MKESLTLQKIALNNSEINELFNYLNQDFKPLERLSIIYNSFRLKKRHFKSSISYRWTSGLWLCYFQTVPTYNWLHVLYLAILPEHRPLGLESTFIKEQERLSKKAAIAAFFTNFIRLVLCVK